jgi:hypothetical protein
MAAVELNRRCERAKRGAADSIERRANASNETATDGLLSR